jgi:hypothetical protein
MLDWWQVIELSKETNTRAGGITKVAGSDKVAAAKCGRCGDTIYIPGVGEVVAGAAAVGKGVVAGAKLAQSAAKSIERSAKQTIKGGLDLVANRISLMRSGMVERYRALCVIARVT